MTADKAACPVCRGTGKVHPEHLRGGMVALDTVPGWDPRVKCPACNTDSSIPPVIVPLSPSAAPGVVPVPRNTRQDGDDTETADEGFWRRLATREDFDPYRIER